MKRPTRLADLVEPVLGPALAAQGFAGADVVRSWPAIVGERLARFSRPVRLDWPRRGAGAAEAREPATLVVRVESAFAIELQHLAPVVLERVNGFYGWRCVGRLALRQGPVGPAPEPRPPPPAADAATRSRVAAAVTGLDDAPLREALRRLGEAATASPPQSPASRQRDDHGRSTP